MQNKKSRAKFVQNFFKIYGILSDSRKIKNDRKRSRIKGFTIFNLKRSDIINGDGGSRTISYKILIFQRFIDFHFYIVQNWCKIIFDFALEVKKVGILLHLLFYSLYLHNTSYLTTYSLHQAPSFSFRSGETNCRI
jgi:hypothetical protein